MTLEGSPKPPDGFVVNTGEGKTIEEVKNVFFDEILDFMGYNQKARVAFAEILPMELHRPDISGQVRLPSGRITLLILRDHITASVLERSNDFGDIEVVFANYLDPEVIQKLRQGL
ncbi:hypothetical protein A2112_02240 [Candidatus Woesebacteria bacterium GWA1_42_12]|uniref:Uncharacterized protein n=1 Tax=Candidatus Woesebacteria bacterium GWA1_42_12 TaxID=1802472 RepID=A0A1F7WLP3_9BACT|nr:MAG: hypothetical protein A2112_02240 [Candidatus Woesebacteria bacterium GWA1_42_12]